MTEPGDAAVPGPDPSNTENIGNILAALEPDDDVHDLVAGIDLDPEPESEPGPEPEPV